MRSTVVLGENNVTKISETDTTKKLTTKSRFPDFFVTSLNAFEGRFVHAPSAGKHVGCATWNFQRERLEWKTPSEASSRIVSTASTTLRPSTKSTRCKKQRVRTRSNYTAFLMQIN